MFEQVKWEDPARERVLEVPQVVALEQAIAAAGTSLDTLMQRAGAAAAQFIAVRWEPGSSVLVLCGTGNNGGDGWVAAQLLARAGYSVRLVTPKPAQKLTAEPARTAALRCMAAQEELPCLMVEVNPAPEAVRAWAADAQVLVDALLGTGFHFASLRQPVADYVAALVDARASRAASEKGALPCPAVVAIDVPSGLNAQEGSASDPAVFADFTVTMMARKTGMETQEGCRLCGDVRVARIAEIEPFLPA